MCLFTMVCQWLFDVWKTVAKPESVVSGFQQCGCTECENDYQKHHSRLRDRIFYKTVTTETA